MGRLPFITRTLTSQSSRRRQALVGTFRRKAAAARLIVGVMRMIDLPQEVRVLNAAAELVESGVNHLICCFYESDDGLITEVKPKDVIEKKYFFVLLLEMVAGVNKELIPGKDEGDNLLTIIRRITENPQLSNDAVNVGRLAARCQEFLAWLAHEFPYDLYSANLGKNIRVMISRKDVLYLVGNRSKHSLIRSNAIMQKLVQKYRDSGVETTKGEEALVLEDIDHWFFDDFCGYHFTKICELCSNLYHAIIEYVRPEYQARSNPESGFVRSCDIPSTLIRSDHISEFYELLGKVRNPWVPVIQTEQMLTLRY